MASNVLLWSDHEEGLSPQLSMTPFLLALPWLGLLLFVLVVHTPTELPGAGGSMRRTPSVSVIVPARNEAVNIVRCLSSIAASTYPEFELIVVDDRSGDDTAALARRVARGNARRLEVVAGEPLPDGWLGKPWACHQGARRATGEILLFTDADTTHGAVLLARAVAGLEEERADLLTLVGRQLMETFWERLVQPQIFLLMLLRFPDFERIARNDRWRDAIANGQYLLFPRASYDAIGGHEAVQDEVVEDLALAQLVKRTGLRLRIRGAEGDLSTRMYRSLGQIVDGWSKNIVIGGLQSVPRWMRPAVAPVSFVSGIATWLIAPALLVWSGAVALVGASPPATVFAWSATVYVISVLIWSWFSRSMGVPSWYGMLYPLGALVGALIFLRSWIRGRDIEWKGRRYRVRAVSERA
jgi:chlorobactene glucosyltransferase